MSKLPRKLYVMKYNMLNQLVTSMLAAILFSIIYTFPLHASQKCITKDSSGHIFDTEVSYSNEDKDSGLVIINVKKGGTLVQKLQSNFESPNFSLDIDSSIDVNSDGISDLAVSTGRGRTADGYHYWMYDTSKKQYIDLGEAQRLHLSKMCNVETLFSLQSSTGDYQSMLYIYQVINSQLKITSSIGFRVTPNEHYYLQYFQVNEEGEFLASGKELGVKKTVFESCQNGICPCH